jgi:hypothetical protein
MDLPQNITTNISIPFIGALVATIASTHPEVAMAWLGISQTYLFLKAMDPRADDFMNKVNKNIGGITEQLVQSIEFQQSLLVTFDALIRARNKQKAEIIKRVYLLGYIPSSNHSAFALERFYQTSQQISLEAIEYLQFIKKEILPRKLASIELKANEEHSNKIEHSSVQIKPGSVKLRLTDEGASHEKREKAEANAVRGEVDSNHIRKWINDNFNFENPKVKEKYNFSTLTIVDQLMLPLNLGIKEREELRKLDENASELTSLGIFRTVPTYNFTGYIITDFGNDYIRFLDKK